MICGGALTKRGRDTTWTGGGSRVTPATNSTSEPMGSPAKGSRTRSRRPPRGDVSISNYRVRERMLGFLPADSQGMQGMVGVVEEHPEVQVFDEISQIEHGVRIAITRALPVGLTYPQYEVLNLIARRGEDITPNAIAVSLRM